MTATFLRPNLWTMLRILLISNGLSVEAILLNSTIRGPTVSVCMTVMCRRRLFDSWLGQLAVPLVKLNCLSSLWVLSLELDCEMFSIPCGVRAMPLRMATRGNRPNRRKMTLTCPWMLLKLILDVAILTLLTWTLLVLIALNLPT